MFDAKSILDALMRGGGQPQSPQQPGLGGLSDLLRQIAASGGQPAAAPAQNGGPPRAQAAPEGTQAPPSSAAAPGAGAGAQGGDLGDLLRSVLGGQGGNLSDILGKLQQAGASPGGIGDVLKQVLGQATSGVREGAGRIDDATGASRYARDAVGQATGRSPDDLMAQLKEMIANNKLGTAAGLGGLGAIILGTGAGRSLAGTAVKLGGLALIGGLAYKAYQNYQQGQPPLPDGRPQALAAAPNGSGFEPGAVTNEHALLLIRAMIAAAAADGRIDVEEQKKILGGLQQAGLGGAAQQFLTREVNHPATIDQLVSAITSKEEALQVYTAARVAVDPDQEEEHEFLAALADRLGIDGQLAAHIDAGARSAGT
jgi:uncharacterized membrane protein YebE (DUF533 family)